MKKTYTIHFLILSIALFAIAYGASILIGDKGYRRQQGKWLMESRKLGQRTIEILGTNDFTDKSTLLDYIYKEYLNKEPALAFYQIGKMKKGLFQPMLGGKQTNSPVFMINLNDLISPTGQAKKEFFRKGPFLIYNQDMLSGTQYYGKLFIAFDERRGPSKSKVFIHIFSFTLGVLFLSIVSFKWYQKKHGLKHLMSDGDTDQDTIPAAVLSYEEKVSTSPDTLRTANRGDFVD